VTENDIPKYNHSLSALTSLIKLCAYGGLSLVVIGVFWLSSALSNGGATDWSIPLLLTYAGASLVGIAIMGALLRHTAKVVVEGLGGSIKEASN
jgi:hypothetical protein